MERRSLSPCPEFKDDVCSDDGSDLFPLSQKRMAGSSRKLNIINEESDVSDIDSKITDSEDIVSNICDAKEDGLLTTTTPSPTVDSHSTYMGNAIPATSKLGTESDCHNNKMEFEKTDASSQDSDNVAVAIRFKKRAAVRKNQKNVNVPESSHMVNGENRYIRNNL